MDFYKIDCSLKIAFQVLMVYTNYNFIFQCYDNTKCILKKIYHLTILGICLILNANCI